MGVATTKLNPSNHPQADEVLSEAFVNAARNLGLTQAAMARLVGLSPATISRLPTRATIHAASKHGELALLFLRAYRSLFSILGGNVEKGRAWFHAGNRHLNGRPVDLVETIEGLNRVVDYLDAMRGR